jgi:pimeloyl-ACP methyl ester carboxylesterase
MRRLLPACLLALSLSTPVRVIAQQPDGAQLLPGGAEWAAEMPAQWNGTLLLWSRGYSSRAGRPETAPAEAKAALLAQGYALAASNYGSGGWALEQAIPAQLATLRAFTARYGQPKRTIAWGASMGGLVTTALAERQPANIDGGIAVCSSIAGSLGMMNMALDGAMAFRTLVAPDAGIALTGISDDRANGAKVGAALDAALKSPEGRARVALAGVLAGIPGWTSRDRLQPPDADHEAQLDEMGRSFVMGVFLPRGDQEARAGQGYSWTTGVDYRRQLDKSGRRALVAALYRKAGLPLNTDLARLNAAPRIASQPAAVAYMQQNYTPTARPVVPLLAVQTVGDGATSPSLQQSYAEAAGRRNFASLWLGQAGHCGFSSGQMMASLRYLEARLDQGAWPKRPADFVVHRPAPMLRPCFRGRACK